MRNVKIIFFCLAMLSSGLVLILTNINAPSSAKEIANAISKNIKVELQEVDEEAQNILSTNADEGWQSATHSFYRVKNNEIIRWNQNQFLPDLQWVEGDFLIKKVRLGIGDFL
ncbi:MAG TPA: hypothetical protein VFE57_11205, partial [Cyclobacteriaceae bacterium]|nr:hypothetical protein [Cyclobacteriaceae bacterium]